MVAIAVRAAAGKAAVRKAYSWLERGPRRRLAFERQWRLLNRLACQTQAAQDAWRDKALAAVVETAAREVPFQRERFRRAGLNPAAVRGVDDLKWLPPVTKAELSSVPEADRLSRTRAATAMWQSTSGSSGEPFRFAFDPFFHARSAAVRGFVYRTLGARGGVVVEMFGGAGVLPHRDSAIAGYDRYVLLSGLPLEVRLREVLRLRPRVLYGSRSALAELAEELERQERALGGLSFVVSTSEPLTTTDLALLQRVFCAPVHGLYGLSEVSCIAFEREPGLGYSVIEGRVIVEVLVDGRPAREGETGQIVVTSLDNHVMPFIRYATGDLATLSIGSECGRAGMVIARIQGRVVDSIRRHDGSLVPLGAIEKVWSHPALAGRVRQWQIEQIGRDALVARAVATPLGLDDRARERIRELVAATVGPGVRIDVALVPAISLEANGKFKPVKVSVT
jgi:phenylacetate-CoA ligase